MPDNQPQWTPGPWRVSNGRCIHANHYCLGNLTLQVAFVNTGRAEYNNEILANARLIAAAPDLYAAVKAFAELMKNYEPGDFEEPTENAVLLQVRAALAKAEGRVPVANAPAVSPDPPPVPVAAFDTDTEPNEEAQ